MKHLIASCLALLLWSNVFACVEMNSFKYCKGNLVINKSGLKAQIIELLGNNRAVVKYHQYDLEEFAKLKDLAIASGSSMGYQMNDEVMTPYGEPGVISGFFQDGNVAIYTDDFWKLKVHSPARIATIDGCTEDQFCVGDIVKNKFNKEGEIVAIFPFDNKVFLAFPRQERYFKWATKDLKHN